MEYNEKNAAGGHRMEASGETQEKELRRSPLFGEGKMREVREGRPMGGHAFGTDQRATPYGDDPANPSQYAGYTNAYFARTEPSEEYTANNNFKAAHQEGAPGNDHAQTNIPGPQELPDQQKVGESNDSQPGKADDQAGHGEQGKPSGAEQDHIET